MISGRHVIVNYHYVEDPNPRFSGIFPCSVAEFDRQMRFLSDNYKIVSAAAVFEAARADAKEKLAAVTFDDGLKGQYQNALPVLKKYGVTAAFFPITGTLEGKLPAAHKVHMLLSRLSVNGAIDFFNAYLAEFYSDFQGKYHVPKDRRLTDRRMHENASSANFKEIMIILPENIRNDFLNRAFAKLELDEKNLAEQIFMSREEILDLKNQKMAVGNHSHNHHAFNALPTDVMRNEILLAAQKLAGILGEQSDIFSYPHGRYNEVARGVLKSEGFKYAFTIERRAPTRTDDPLKIPRYDANDLLTN